MTVCSYSLKNVPILVLKKIINLLSYFGFGSLDPNWAKILDPDPNLMYLDPQHWYHVIELLKPLNNNIFEYKMVSLWQALWTWLV